MKTKFLFQNIIWMALNALLLQINIFMTYLKQHLIMICRMVAVLNQNGHFEGVITLEDTINAFAESTASSRAGSYFGYDHESRDYSLAELSRIIEAEDVKILSSTVNNDPKDYSLLRVTLKLNKTEVSHVTASLERVGYKIIEHFQEEELKSNDQERFDLLMRYLNI